MGPRHPGNEFDPAEWLRAWRRVLGVLFVVAAIVLLLLWGDSLTHDVALQRAVMVGAFVGMFAGSCLIAWSVFVVGRQVSRALWRLLRLAEGADRHRAENTRETVDHFP